MSDPSSLPDRSHVLYRMYDSTRRLLYVGITFDASARFRQHGETKNWWAQVASIDVAHFADRRSALAAERAAIRAEDPEHNVQHRRRERPSIGRGIRAVAQRHRNFRLEDSAWDAFGRIAEIQGVGKSETLRDELAGYVRRNRKLLEADPVWQDWKRQRSADT